VGPEQTDVVLGNGAPQQTLLQQAFEHDVMSHLQAVPTQCSPAVEHVPPFVSLQTPPAPSEPPHVFAPLQFGVLHTPWKQT
jgi:hypothetical protein